MADELGVEPSELTPDVSLTDDLAADSLDLLAVAMAAEHELEITIPETALATVRTYGDLTRAVVGLVELRAQARPPYHPAMVRARVVPGDADGHGWLQRAGSLTPYAAETIVGDALSAGRGARLEVEMPSTASDAEVAQVAERFARLPPRGVDVRVRRTGSAMGWPGGPVRRTAS